MGSRAGVSEQHHGDGQSQTAYQRNSATRPSQQAPSNKTHKDPRSRSMLRPDIETGPTDRLSTTKEGRNERGSRHYHHRDDPRSTGQKRYPTGKWEPGCHPADKEKRRGPVSSITTGLSKLLGLNQTSIQESWGKTGPNEKPQAGGSYIV